MHDDSLAVSLPSPKLQYMPSEVTVHALQINVNNCVLKFAIKFFIIRIYRKECWLDDQDRWKNWSSMMISDWPWLWLGTVQQREHSAAGAFVWWTAFALRALILWHLQFPRRESRALLLCKPSIPLLLPWTHRPPLFFCSVVRHFRFSGKQ